MVAGVAAVLGACVASETTPCEDGSVCAVGLVCARVADQPLCVDPGQLAACGELPELAPCDLGVCHDHVCLPVGCGNGRVDPGEQCDDGNNAGGDGCAADCASDETCGNGVIDLVTGEACDDGAAGAGLSHDGCTGTCVTETPRWSITPRLAELLAVTSGRTSALAFDPLRNRAIGFGANAGIAATFTWDGARFTLLDPPLSPPGRIGANFVFDTHRDRAVLFGGGSLDDTWEWDGVTWTNQPVTVHPAARQGASSAYDAAGRRMVVFGGTVPGSTTRLGDTWQWDGVTWTQLATPGPPPRTEATLAYDPRRGVLVLFGGLDANGAVVDETWELAGSTWTRRTPPSSPPARHGHVMAFDPVDGRTLIHGGYGAASDTWAWDGTTWTQLADDVPGNTHYLVQTDRGQHPRLLTPTGNYRWTGSGWTLEQGIEGTAMALRFMAGAADLAGHRVVIHGGLKGIGTSNFPHSQTVIWAGGWTTLPVPGVTPGPILFGAMAYDARRREFVLFGGSRADVAIAETWVFDGEAWTQRTPATSPPARAGHTLVYDAARGVTVLFGGINGVPPSGLLADTWTWDGTTWTKQATTSAPSPRRDMAATYDPDHENIVLFGGNTGVSIPNGETWLWDGQTWTQQPVAGPNPRFTSAIAWDAARRRAVLFGGGTAGSVSFNDAWEWDGSRWTALPASPPLRRRSGHLMTSSTDGPGVLSFGGADTTMIEDVAWLRWTSSAPDETCNRRDDDHDGRGAASCTDDPDCWSTCTPTCPPGTSCPADARRCGDGVCEPGRETCVNCFEDCGACAPRCGDFSCNGAESIASCPGDCA